MLNSKIFQGIVIVCLISTWAGAAESVPVQWLDGQAPSLATGVSWSAGANPVLITSMERKSGVQNDTLRDSPEKVRKVTREDKVALIDLHAMSKVLYKALGDDLDKAFQDGTHHNNYGSTQLAKCVAQGIKDNNLTLADYLTLDFNRFDPNTPDTVHKEQTP